MCKDNSNAIQENNPGDMTKKLAGLVHEAGGKTYYVGGYVRDHLLGIDNKDIDIEIHGITEDRLRTLLSSLGERRDDGADYGIYGIAGYEIDIALPRREMATGHGHKDFKVTVDPFMGSKEAASRRDFTINALMQDVLTGEIVDPFGGLCHMDHHILHMVNQKTFREDPLRALRGAQFAARFSCRLSDETIDECKHMDLTSLAGERIYGELKKALLKADQPSIFFEELKRMDQLSFWFPELEALIGVEQNPRFHPEGDVWNHTMAVIDAAAKRREESSDPLSFMFSALFHDIGKPATTEFIKGAIHSYGHEMKGAGMVEAALGRLYGKTSQLRYVENMIRYHMRPNQLVSQKSGQKAYFKLYDESIAPYDLILLSQSDLYGKGPDQISPDQEETFAHYKKIQLDYLDQFQDLMALPHVEGKDLIRAGLKPGKEFSEILSYGHKLRVSGVNKEVALKECLHFARKYPSLWP